MKWIVLFAVLFFIVDVSYPQAGQKKLQDQTKSRGQMRPLHVESDLIRDEYQVFAVIELKKPIAEHSYILAKSKDTQVEIRTAENFAQIVRGISAPEKALEMARLLTSQEIRPFLKDVYYGEVHKKVAQQEGERENRWFAIAPEQYNEWKLYEPVVTEENGVYKIERFVATYPRRVENEFIEARLVKIWEWIDAEGKYWAEIQEVIAEGDEIRKILIFTK